MIHLKRLGAGLLGILLVMLAAVLFMTTVLYVPGWLWAGLLFAGIAYWLGATVIDARS